jgi:adenosylcobinamide-GDP ribazoletransferase
LKSKQTTLGFLIAIQFLTIFPVARLENDPDKCGTSLSYFPLVGLILGGILFGAYYGLSYIIPFSVTGALLIAIQVIMTGAHHIDGLMDTFDALVIGKTGEQRLAIMSDGKVGAFGIVAAILLLIIKYVSLIAVPAMLPALLLMPVLSRWSIVAMIYIFPYARAAGSGKPFKQGARWYRVIAATVVTTAIAFLLLNWQGLLLMAALLVISPPPW